MIIVRLMGGLGNQMFQYACGWALALRTGHELEYWFNQALPRRRLGRLARDLRRAGGAFRSFSYQHYHE